MSKKFLIVSAITQFVIALPMIPYIVLFSPHIVDFDETVSSIWDLLINLAVIFVIALTIVLMVFHHLILLKLFSARSSVSEQTAFRLHVAHMLSITILVWGFACFIFTVMMGRSSN